MQPDQIWRHIDEQRTDLADVLATLRPQQWNTPSPCEGWTVRDVAAHLTLPAVPATRLVIESLRSGFRFNAMIADLARRDPRTPEQLVAAIRGMVGLRRHPPGTKPIDPLMDLLVHGQDIAQPLGLARTMPMDAAVAVAERLWGMRFPFHPARQYPGVEFRATDAAFRVGHGQRLSGPIQDIVLVLAGRAPLSALAPE